MGATQQVLLALGALEPLPGMLLWLDAPTINLSDGSAVTTWADQSGNGNDAGQAVTLSKPVYNTSAINSRPAVKFTADDGTRDFLSCAGPIVTTVGTIYVAFRPTAFPTAYNVMIDTQGGVGLNGFFFGQKSAGNSAWYWRNTVGTGPAWDGSGPGTAINTNYIESIRWNATSGDGTINNATDSSCGAETGTQTGGLFTLGAELLSTSRWQGWIAELLVYGTKHSDADRTTMNTYLNSKYAAY